MPTLTSGTYDEALERLHRTGPEFDGWLSNHGPMVVEALSRHGAGADVHAWVDAYSRRLEELPRSTSPVTDDDWTDALGDPRRLADWLAFFERRLTEARWTDELATWWPRLLPGIAAGATHGVIRVGHAARALREEENAVRVRELAHGLGYWAARWQTVPVPARSGVRDAADLVGDVPRVPRQDGGIRERLAQLPGTEHWLEHGAELAPTRGAGTARQDVAQIVDAVVLAYPRIAVGQPTMLVHAATAPSAVARTLPSLPEQLWAPSVDAAWAATMAVLAAYRPRVERPAAGGQLVEPQEVWEVAVRCGGEHVIKLADTALEVYERTGDERALASVTTAVELDA